MDAVRTYRRAGDALLYGGMTRNRRIAFVIALVVVALVLLTSCGGKAVDGSAPEDTAQFTRIVGNKFAGIYKFEYDGCTYLYASGSGKAITHHAGCENPNHIEDD